MSALDHPNIVTVQGVGRVRALSFLATEYVQGCTIRELVRNGPLECQRVAEIGLQVGLVSRVRRPAASFIEIAVLYEMLTSQAVAKGDTPSDTIAAVLVENPEPFAKLCPSYPASLILIVNRTLEKDRDTPTHPRPI